MSRNASPSSPTACLRVPAGADSSAGQGSRTRRDDVLDLRHVPVGGRVCLLRRAPLLPRAEVGGVPVPPVVRRGGLLEAVVVLGGLVQQLCQRGDVHVSPPIPAQAAES